MAGFQAVTACEYDVSRLSIRNARTMKRFEIRVSKRALEQHLSLSIAVVRSRPASPYQENHNPCSIQA
ncbi:hypothetical protein KCV00_g135, partial [Aureobasidium melanogenum]